MIQRDLVGQIETGAVLDPAIQAPAHRQTKGLPRQSLS